MATDLERLIVSLDASTTKFERALTKANATAKKQLTDIQRQFTETNKKLNEGLSFGGLSFGGLKGGLDSLKGGAAGLAGAFAADKIKDYADAWTEAGNKIAASAVVSGRSARSLDEINKIATGTRSGLGETVDLYAKLLRATAGVAKNEQEVADATEIVNKAFKAGGAEASEQAAGILQLSQALSSGILQGDELRSIRENAPLIAQAIANEFKTTIGGLKQLGADGKLSVDRVFQAILNAKPMIDRAYGATSATIAEGFTLVNNAVTEAIGKLSDVTGASHEVGSALADVSSIISGLSDALVSVAGSPAGKFLGFLDGVLEKFEPLKASLKLLADANVQKAIGGAVDAAGTAATGTTASQIKDVTEAMDAFFKARDEGTRGGYLTAEQGKGFDDLRDKLALAKISAEDASKEVRRLVELDPGTSPQIIDQFDLMIVKLKAIKVAAEAAKVSASNLNTDDRAQSRADQEGATAYAAFVSGRNADANRTDLQKDIDTRAKQIESAAQKVGVAITDAAAKIQAAKELAAEDIAKSASKSVTNSVDMVKQFEGFISKPKYDVNAYRAGYGSDTVTLADGSVQKITQGMSVSVADANRDLVRRIGEFQDGIKNKIGADTFNGFDENQQAALTSLAYNYGSLPDRIVAAIKTGNQATVVQAIRGLGSDNGGINKDRRNTEADTFLGGAPSGVKKAVQGQDKFNNNLAETQRQIDLLNEQAKALGLVNPLINDYGYAQSKAEIKQKLINDAMAAGVEITPEYAAKIDALAEKYANADAARNQMQQGVENLSQKMAESSALGKDVLGGFIKDLESGKSATEALSNALSKVADKLLEVGLNALFDGPMGGKSGGGILGGLFSFLFADGGYTGNGGKNEPAGIVHKGEVVWSQDDVRRWGGPQRVDSMRRGYANGGIVGGAIPMPAMPGRIPGRGGSSTDTVRLVLQDDSGRMADIADRRIQTHSGTIVEVAVQRSTKAVKGQMPGLIANAQARNL
ncbi:tape measure protein [Mesorhizobium sp. M0830]|uniref:tape measure protein n=1 Tax=Mesorhizobium sp. M0830 TaxID=2957008 RepID=UPI00333C5D62